MGHLDARDALASTPDSTVSDRKSQSRRRTRAASHERSGRLLHDIFPSAVVGLFRFRFRTWIFVLLVHEGFRITASGCVGTATNRRPELLARDFRRDLGTIFQLRAMVVFVARHASRNDHHLGDLPGMRGVFFQRSTSRKIGAGAGRFHFLRHQFRALSLSALPNSAHAFDARHFGRCMARKV